MPMCRVTFFDKLYQMKRTLEVEADTPQAAAETALGWHLDQDRLLDDFGPSVRVEVITTVEHVLPLRNLSQRTIPAQKSRVA